MTLFKGTPKNRGWCIQDTVENQQNGILICSADQRKTMVTKIYKLVVLLERFVHGKKSLK